MLGIHTTLLFRKEARDDDEWRWQCSMSVVLGSEIKVVEEAEESKAKEKSEERTVE